MSEPTNLPPKYWPVNYYVPISAEVAGERCPRGMMLASMDDPACPYPRMYVQREDYDALQAKVRELEERLKDRDEQADVREPLIVGQQERIAQQPDERERAEQYVQTLREDFTLLDDPDHKGWLSIRQSELIDALLAIMREERARTWEEARGLLLAQQCHEPFYGSAIYKQVVVDFARWIDKIVDMCEERAQALRKEGGKT